MSIAKLVPYRISVCMLNSSFQQQVWNRICLHRIEFLQAAFDLHPQFPVPELALVAGPDRRHAPSAATGAFGMASDAAYRLGRHYDGTSMIFDDFSMIFR